ncbi:hypothetical protein BJV74DRAFT_798279 [Russula compacta]|nr:hypothetical protein BJV74DRAFT_798279 [Russula compacta]
MQMRTNEKDPGLVLVLDGPEKQTETHLEQLTYTWIKGPGATLAYPVFPYPTAPGHNAVPMPPCLSMDVVPTLAQPHCLPFTWVLCLHNQGLQVSYTAHACLPVTCSDSGTDIINIYGAVSSLYTWVMYKSIPHALDAEHQFFESHHAYKGKAQYLATSPILHLLLQSIFCRTLGGFLLQS